MWLVRHGKSFYLQSSTTKFVINWGDRSTARLFGSEQEASCVIDALLKTGHYWGYNFSLENLHLALTNVPSELLDRLQDCAQKLMEGILQPEEPFPLPTGRQP